MLLIFKSGAYGLHLFDRIMKIDFGLFCGAVLWILAVSATFLWIFPAVSLWLGELFCGFQRFQLLFWRIFRLFRWVRGAVLGISAVSATFFQNFSSFWAGLGSCFRSFMDYSYPSPACYQPMAMYIKLI